MLARFVAEARKEDGSPYPPKTIQALLTRLLRYARASTGKEPPNFLQKDDLRFKSLHNAIANVYRDLLGQGIGIQTNSAATLTIQLTFHAYISSILNFTRISVNQSTNLAYITNIPHH